MAAISRAHRLLPAEITGLRRNDVRQPCLHDVQFCAARHLLERHRHLDFTRQVGIIEFVRVEDTLIRHEFEILTAEGMTLACGEIPERHFKPASGFRIQFVHGAGETIGWQPFRERITLKKGAIDLFGFRGHDPMKTDGVGHLFPPWSIMRLLDAGPQ